MNYARWDDDYEDPEELMRLVKEGSLPRDHIVTGADLLMNPGQSLDDKARELGCSRITLRMWQLEHRGARYDPAYAIRRAGHRRYGANTNQWTDKDWPRLVREEIAKGHARHVGDVLISLGLSACTAQVWSRKHPSFEQALWKSGVPYPRQHWNSFVRWLAHSTIERYRELQSAYIAQGISETEARHRAADDSVNEVKHKTRQRRRVERDQLVGVTMGEEMLRRWRAGGRLWDAHSRRLGKTLLRLTRYAAMERGLREAGFKEKEIEAKIGELKEAFAQSSEAGQEKWQRVRKGILRKKAHREAKARADRAEARAIKQLPGVKASKYVKQQLEAR